MAERIRVRARTRATDRRRVVRTELRSAAALSRWYLNCPCCGLTITPRVRSFATRQFPRCLARTSTTVELFSSPLPADVLTPPTRTQRRRAPTPSGATTMRNAMAIAEVRRALGVAWIGSGATASDQRRAAELRIELRRARVLTHIARRLRASPSRLAVDGQAARRPSMAAPTSVSPGVPRVGETACDRTTSRLGGSYTDAPPDRAARSA